jgi:hypothetical protein
MRVSRIDLRSIATFRLFVGISIKTLGYLVITAGIFLSIKNKDVAFRIVQFGVLMVVAGWLLIIRALKVK